MKSTKTSSFLILIIQKEWLAEIPDDEKRTARNVNGETDDRLVIQHPAATLASIETVLTTLTTK